MPQRLCATLRYTREDKSHYTHHSQDGYVCDCVCVCLQFMASVYHMNIIYCLKECDINQVSNKPPDSTIDTLCIHISVKGMRRIFQNVRAFLQFYRSFDGRVYGSNEKWMSIIKTNQFIIDTHTHTTQNHQPDIHGIEFVCLWNRYSTQLSPEMELKYKCRLYNRFFFCFFCVFILYLISFIVI